MNGETQHHTHLINKSFVKVAIMQRIKLYHVLSSLLIAQVYGRSMVPTTVKSSSSNHRGTPKYLLVREIDLLSMRGGDQRGSEPSRKRSKGSKSGRRKIKSTSEISQAISDDPAKMMGDAIR